MRALVGATIVIGGLTIFVAGLLHMGFRAIRMIDEGVSELWSEDDWDFDDYDLDGC